MIEAFICYLIGVPLAAIGIAILNRCVDKYNQIHPGVMLLSWLMVIIALSLAITELFIWCFNSKRIKKLFKYDW